MVTLQGLFGETIESGESRLQGPSDKIPANWYDTDWKARKSWTIDNAKVSGSSTISDFPVLINVTDTDFQKARADGFDFVVTSSDGMTKIPHEIQEWDDVTGKLVLWFKENVLHNVDTGGFIYYDKPASTDQQDSVNVWTDNHHIVLHLSETPAGVGSIKDSTSNARHGDPTGGIERYRANWQSASR